MKYILPLLVCLVAVGCSSRGAYEGVKASSRLECSKLPESQYDDCMAKASEPYSDYERDREELIK